MRCFLTPSPSQIFKAWLRNMGLGAIAGILVVGLYADSKLVRPPGRVPTAIVKQNELSRFNPALNIPLHYAQLFRYAFQMPSRCWTGDYLNSFHRDQCLDAMERFGFALLLGLFPLFVAWFVFQIASDRVRSVYRKGRVKKKKGLSFGVAKVLESCDLQSDAFSKYFLMRRVKVQLKNASSDLIGVGDAYIPLSDTMPLPGERVLLFDAGTVFGKKRWLATLYAPHVDVMG